MQITANQIGTLCVRNHQPNVTKGKAVRPIEMHQIEYGKTLWSNKEAIASAKDTGSAHTFSREMMSRRLLETNKATKNQITPTLNLPQGVTGP